MSNPVRNCVVCGQRDDHPRCQVILPDGSSAYHHHDCGALLEPACAPCEWLAQHKGDLKGDDWRAHVLDLHDKLSDDEIAKAPWERSVLKSHANGKAS